MRQVLVLQNDADVPSGYLRSAIGENPGRREFDGPQLTFHNDIWKSPPGATLEARENPPS